MSQELRNTVLKYADMFGNIKRVKHIEAQSFLVGGFCGYSKHLKPFFIHL